MVFAAALLGNFGQNKENFGQVSLTLRGIQLFLIIISILPAYLSWNCGLKSGLTVDNNILRLILNSFAAFLYGIFYLISYYLKIGCCHV